MEKAAASQSRLVLVQAFAGAKLSDEECQPIHHLSAMDAAQDWRGDPVDQTSVTALVRKDSRGEKLGLVIVSAPEPGLVGSHFAIQASALVIGRADSVDIRVDDPGVSRNHVKLTRGPLEQFIAQDLGSRNGTWLNGVAIQSAAIKEGDRLQIGNSTEFLFGSHVEGAQAEIRLRQAISTVGAGTWEWLPATGELRFYGGIARAVGYENDTTEPRVEDSWARVLPEDREALRTRFETALQQGIGLQSEVRLQRRDGRIAWVAVTGEPFRDLGGRLVRLAGTLLDVSERRRAEVELRRQSLLFDSLADAVVVVGSDGTILDWSASAERLLGWRKTETLGRCPGALLRPGDEGRLDGTLTECARRGGRRSEELTLKGKSGSEVPVEMVAVPLNSREEGLVACVAVFRDLGERKRLQARLQVAERLASLGTLAAGVAHEINNPLAFVASNLDFLSKELAGAASDLGPRHAEIKAALADTRKGADRIANIVRDLQAFSGRLRPDSSSTVEPNEVLEFALRMADRQIRLRAKLVKDLMPVPDVQGSDAKLGQVFLNILVNATQAIVPGSASGNVIRVSSRFDPGSRRVVVEVSDDGVGIPAEVLPRIFEPFYTTKPVGVGTGLGLFVCQGILAELGGEITVESEVGKGTTVRVALPTAGSGPRAVPSRPRLLLVDDEPLLGSAMKRYFSDQYDVVTMTDPRKALERIQAGEYFLFAIVDLQMPEMTGQELLARMRESAPDLALRTAIVTGDSPDEVIAKFREGECPLVLSKPIDLARLAAIIDAAAGGVTA